MGNKKERIYFLSLASAFILGVCLRLYLLKDQVLIDDEWHGLLFIKDKSFFEVLSLINPNRNSSPLLNIYSYLCYHSIGVSEWNLRLPLLVTGCALVIILPILVRKIVHDRTGIIFSFLLALSPFLIFYSRFSRSYIIIALLSFFVLLTAFQWITTNKRAHAIGFILISIIDVYTHPVAIAIALSPYVTLAIAFLIKRLDSRNSIAGYLAVPVKTALKVMMVHAIGLVAVTSNYIFNSGNVPLDVKAARASDILNTLHLISGTTSTTVLVVFFALALLGCLRMYKITSFLTLLLCTGVVFNVFFILVINPFGIESSAVFLRYCIVIIPVILLFTAVSVHDLLDVIQKRIAMPFFRQIVPVICISAGVLLLYFNGPLPVIYRAPNNFTGHLAFQGSYQYGDWQKSRSNHYFPSYEISKQDIPAFYKWLATDTKSQAIIEYPFDFADHSNLLYFYQIYHRKRVLVGYCSDPNLIAISVTPEMYERRKRENLVLAYTRPEFFLSDANVKKRTHFRNMIDVADDSEVLHSQADYLVLHKMVQSIYITKNEMGTFPLFDQSVSFFKEHYARILGEPKFEDDQIIVFALTRK
ncbi:MAG TPA: hypothetical protein VLX29_00285 [Nitrospirota bacterium]|nr:hypothetical protein [Nitrospirota bacterium]HUK99273.1 hypothetical protein [Nitrospirota bacterium]